MEKIKKLDRNSVMLAVCAVLGIIVVSVTAVMVVRAYLTAITDNKINPFAPMTYTNTEIEEPTSSWPDTPQDTSYDVYINKSAKVKNLPGADKKPVFIRVAVTYSVYDASGVNVTSDYPVITTDHDNELVFTQGTNWTAKQSDGYFYYNKIVLPGGQTDEFFGSAVKVDFGKTLPDGYKVEIDVIADTVQAVSTDSSKWKELGGKFSATEVSLAWGKTPTGDPSGDLPAVTATGDGLKIKWPASS
ncbi:MAG: hypothetical protein IJM51_07940 [Clostridia bacterium]|nr:hypothetical protein [Clostridia bacterium]